MKSDRAFGVDCSPPVSHFSFLIGWSCCKASMISVHMAFPAGGLTLSLTATDGMVQSYKKLETVTLSCSGQKKISNTIYTAAFDQQRPHDFKQTALHGDRGCQI